jgi:uncharacterized membrane protein YhaH (DUF805 family)
MEELTANVNWLAVIIGTVASFMLGWAWYSPALFGKTWAAGSGVDLANANAMPVAPLAFQLLATFLLAWLIGITATHDALLTAILILITVAMFVATNSLFVKKSTAAILIETSFVLAMGVVMIIVQALI